MWPNLKVERGAVLIVLAAVLVGAFPRLIFALRSDFPLNDGGLFYVMIRDLQAAGYALPTVIAYNSAGIPFAYPPLGLYVGGRLSDWFHWPLLDVMRLVPPLVSVATLPVYYGLTRALAVPAGPARLALFALALLPVGFDWMVMGGGITRSFGLLFALATLQQAQLLFTRPQRRYILTTGLAAGLTGLSHLGLAWFAAYSVGLLFLFSRPSRRTAARAGLGLGVALAVLAPWLLTLWLRSGVQPFVAAWQSNGLSWWSVVTPLFFLFTNEPLIDLAAVLGPLGLLCCVRDRRPLLPVWLGVIFLLQSRATPAVAVIPFALLVGVGLNDLVLPGLRRMVTGPPGSPAPRPDAGPAGVLLLAYLLLTGTISAYLTTPQAALPPEQRTAMAWVSAHTPAAARFAVITTASGWEADMVSEWFPALTTRVSLATPQGFEWLPQQFQPRRRFYAALQACAAQTVACLTPLLPTNEAGPVYLYLSGEAASTESPLLVSLGQSDDYQVVYSEPSVRIFVRDSSAGVD